MISEAPFSLDDYSHDMGSFAYGHTKCQIELEHVRALMFDLIMAVIHDID